MARGAVRAALLASSVLASAGCDLGEPVVFPESLTDRQGAHVGAIAGLETVERSPDGSLVFETGRSCYSGDFRFVVPPSTDPSKLDHLRLHVAFSDPGVGGRRWSWSVYRPANGDFEEVGDTSEATSASWTLYDLELPGAPESYLSNDGAVIVRFGCFGNAAQRSEGPAQVDFMGLILAPEGGGSPSEPPPVDPSDPSDLPDAVAEARIQQFRAIFDTTLASNIAGWENLARIGANDSTQYYLLALPLDGILSMFEATGDTTYLETALELMETMISKAFVTGSGSWTPALGWRRTDGSSSLLDEIQAVQPMARVSRMVLTDAGLTSRYGSRARAIRDWADTNIMRKWMVARHFGNYSTGWEWMTSVQNEPLGVLSGYIQGHQLLAMRAARNLYDAGVVEARRGNGTWANLANQIADVWKSRLVVQSNGSYLWDQGTYVWTASTAGIVDTAHSNKYPAALLDLYEAGVKFDGTDAKRLAKTFTRNIWNGRTDWSDPMAPTPGAGSIWFSNYIDGQDRVYSEQYYRAGGVSHPHYNRPEGMSSMVYDGWCRLGVVDEEAEDACEALLAFIRATPDTVNAVRNRNEGAGIGTLALAGHLARNLRFRTW